MSRLEERLAHHRKARKRRFITVLALVLAFGLVTGLSYWGFSLFFAPPATPPGGLFVAENKINIMVMGVDERGDDVGRSDTLFVLMADSKSNAVSMLSIPRDTRVKYPAGQGYDKINHAYATGGPPLTQKLVENLLGVQVNYYVKINIAGFQKLIDAAGGVEIDVEKRMYYEDPWDDDGGLVIDFQPGLQRMNGKTAMQYVRYRDEEGDIGRIERQQKFIKALLARVASPTVLPRLPSIIQEVANMIETNMPKSEMLRLTGIVGDAYKKGIKTDMVPGTPIEINEVDYWMPDVVALREHVAQTLGVALSEQNMAITQKDATEYQSSLPKETRILEKTRDPLNPVKPKTPDKPKGATAPTVTTTPTRVRVDILNASGTPDGPGKMANLLRAQGFDVGIVTTASAPQRSTVIVAYTNDRAVVGKLTSLPFTYALQVAPDSGKTSQARVIVGRDFMEK